MNKTATSNDDFPRVYASTQRFTAGKPRTFQIVNGGQVVLFCRSRTPDDATLALWKFDVATKTEHLLVDPTTLGTETDVSEAEQQRRERSRESGGGIVSYQTSSTGHACFVLNQNLYVVDIETGSHQRVTTQTPVFDPRFNPAGTHIAYVHHQDLRVVKLNPDQTTPDQPEAADRIVASATSSDTSYGRADFIAAEEIGRSRGFWWSPDGTNIAIAKVDDSRVSEWWISQPSQPAAPPQPIKYPAAGTTNTTTSLAIASIDNDKRPTGITFDDEYLVNVSWTSLEGPLVTTQSRDQKTINIQQLDFNTRSLRTLHSINDDRWVDVIPGTPRQTTSGLITVENHTDPTTGKKYRALCVDGQPRTEPDLDIQSLLSVSTGDEPSVTLSVWAPPARRNIVCVNLVTGVVSPIVDLDRNVHGTTTASLAVITTASSSVPGSETTIYQIDDGQAAPVHTITSHHQSADFSPKPEWFSLEDGRVEATLFLPKGHDGRTQLPVLLDPYGGPHARRVQDTHDGHLVSQWFANKGYAVLVADGRGTPGRGPAIEQAVWGNLADPVLDDQLLALDAVAQTYDFIDLDRVAIRGWSFGGYLAALAVLRRPDRFHCALAGAPVTSWHLYDTHYTERYLGHPERYPKHYEQTDLIDMVENLDPAHPKRDLLLIHGLADDNVVAAHTLQLSTALVGAGYPHHVLPLSGVTHMTPHVVVAENLLRLQLEFLVTSIKPSY